MLLQQRIEFDPHVRVPVGDLPPVFIRIALSSTLWTTIEEETETPPLGDSHSNQRRSHIFPSRILEYDKTRLAVTISGVDLSCLLLRPQSTEARQYRLKWRIVPDSEEDAIPLNSVVLPIGKVVTFTFAYGSSRGISVGIGGCHSPGSDLILAYDLATRTLSTSWFSIPFSSSWSIGAIPRLLIDKFWKSSSSRIEGQPPPLITTSSVEPVEYNHEQSRASRWFHFLSDCCPRGSEPSTHQDADDERI